MAFYAIYPWKKFSMKTEEQLAINKMCDGDIENYLIAQREKIEFAKRILRDRGMRK